MCCALLDALGRCLQERHAFRAQYEVGVYEDGDERGDIPASMKAEARDFFRYLAGKSNVEGVVQYSNLVEEGATRVIAAKAFYHVLVLSTMGMVDPAQDGPYADIRISMAHAA